MGRPRRSSSGGSASHLLETIGCSKNAASGGAKSASRRPRLSSAVGGGGGGGGDYHDSNNAKEMFANACAVETRRLLECMLDWRDSRLCGILHCTMDDSYSYHDDHVGDKLALASAWLVRLQQLEKYEREKDAAAVVSGTKRGPSSQPPSPPSLRHLWLVQPDSASGYTPLHSAVCSGNLAMILLLLRHASYQGEEDDYSHHNSLPRSMNPPRLAFRPMDAMLEVDTRSPSASLLQLVTAAVDNEGLTPGGLIMSLQKDELRRCRLDAVDQPQARMDVRSENAGRRRRSSFDLDGDSDENEQNELHTLQRGMRELSSRPEPLFADPRSDGASSCEAWYGCEVFTFGRAHHCALGAITGGLKEWSAAPNDSSSQGRSSARTRPHRVIQFALGSQSGRVLGGAVAVSGAAHHTLVVTRNGRLYAFGLGKGGRLGTGNESHCAIPTLVGGMSGLLRRKHVVSASAAENHSLCVTRCGQVFSWGSNRFGQLGLTGSQQQQGEDLGGRCLPRRVDDLKSIPCVAVSAGARHSVALSKRGEVYVWGDNSAGQLGISRRTGVHKVQRVEALWQANSPRVAIDVSASDQATLVLTMPNDHGLRVNIVYSWGHGNHVPTRVHFEPFVSGERSRLVNPVSIASARFHSVAVTSNGQVYTWGLHSDPLGTGKDKASQVVHSPQLVTGMLPENGGGFVVGAAASENHTAVVTDTGALFTWGATYGKNILGHEGVRWQPNPKQVSGVHRAVGVAAAKEHTVLLIGTSFPRLPAVSSDATLEQLASSVVAKQVDMFSVIPTLITAERTQCNDLIAYCEDFVRRNLDGVLNVAQRSAMDCYLDEQIASSTYASSTFTCATLNDDDERDARLHPVFRAVARAGNPMGSGLSDYALSSIEDWLATCATIAECGRVKVWLRNCAINGRKPSELDVRDLGQHRSRSSSETKLKDKSLEQGCSERCLRLTKNMDLSSHELAEAHLACLTKEIRSARKRLSQISKLQCFATAPNSTVTDDELAKIARRPQLEADLLTLEPALQVVQKRLHELSLDECKPSPISTLPEEACSTQLLSPMKESVSSLAIPSLRCVICKISCPDGRSYTLHINGRKHRNKMMQVEDEERAAIAASITEQRAKGQLQHHAPKAPGELPPKSPTVPWKLQAPCPTPPYTLPSPPVPIPDSIVRTAQPVRLRDIMVQQARGKSSTNLSSQRQTPPQPFSLPPGSAPPLKSPPWAKAKTTLFVDNPTMKVPSVALGDFFTTHPAPDRVAPGRRTSDAEKPAWGVAHSTAASSPQALSFRDIQDQEMDFKLRQDKAVGLGVDRGNRKWFVEQRERAASIHDIQRSDEEERQRRLFVEDQFRIEKQIQEEIEARKWTEKKEATKSKGRSRSRKAKQSSKVASDTSPPRKVNKSFVL